MASDVGFLLSRAQALQQDKGQNGPVTLEHLFAAMQETGAAQKLQHNEPHGRDHSGAANRCPS